MITTSQEENPAMYWGGHSNEVIPGVVSSPFPHVYLSFVYKPLLLNIAQLLIYVSIMFGLLHNPMTSRVICIQEQASVPSVTILTYTRTMSIPFLQSHYSLLVTLIRG
jgi:hypothetical protein